MKRTFFPVAPLLAVTLAVVPLAGCTAIGYGLGTLIDRNKEKQIKPVGGAQDVQTLKPGTSVELQLYDGRVLRGRYQGLDWRQTDGYTSEYETARQSLTGIPLPRLGPGARLAMTSGVVTTGDLLGFGPGFVILDEGLGEEPRRVPFHRVVSLADAEGRTIEGPRLESLVAGGQVPLVARLRLEQPDGAITVPYGDIMSVGRVESPHGARTAGLIVGAVADAIIIASLATWDGSWDDSSSDTTETSCPFIDSFDGQGWSLDAEPLAGAIYPAAQRSDTVRLAHLVSVDGEYRLRLRNDQAEIDHVDAIALRVVDHDPGVEIVPDGQGRLHAVRAPVSPVRGHDLRGFPTATRLAAADGDLWVSDPWGRSSDRAEDLRDGVELEFDRPPGEVSATLVVRAGTTRLGPRILMQALALHGHELPAFYAQLDHDPEARATFERVREREVLPTVRIWDGHAWRASGFLREPPTRVLRDVAVPLDLRGVNGDRLRVRIDGPPGLWSLDRAVVGWPSEDGFQELRVPLARAIGERGEVLTDLLAHIDARRHVLRPHRDRVTLGFLAPPVVSGLARSVLVETTGYYVPLVPVEGGPEHAAFRRLIEEPGAVARFILERLRSTPAERSTTHPSM